MLFDFLETKLKLTDTERQSTCDWWNWTPHPSGRLPVEHKYQQNHQALLKAKYCPRIAAELCTQKKTKKTHVTLNFDPGLEIQ